MIDLQHPQYELKEGVYVTLESVASLDGLVGIGDVHLINLRDAWKVMETAEYYCREMEEAENYLIRVTAYPSSFKLVLAKDDTFAQTFGWKYVEGADRDPLIFDFTYQRHPRDGLVAVSYKELCASELPFPSLKQGLQEMRMAHHEILKALEEIAREGKEDTEVTAGWKKRQPYLAERFSWPEPISEEVSTEVRKHLWDERNRADPLYSQRDCMRRERVSQYCIYMNSGVKEIGGYIISRYWPTVPA